jgi:hypothetical protein
MHKSDNAAIEVCVSPVVAIWGDFQGTIPPPPGILKLAYFVVNCGWFLIFPGRLWMVQSGSSEGTLKGGIVNC